MAKLKFATLTYGQSMVKVIPHKGLPIPAEFDFDNPVDCAKKIMAIMSNASGGWLIKDIKLSYSREYDCANISGNGAHVYFGNDQKLSLDAVLNLANTQTIVKLGSVSSDQYGDGWKRAKWS